MEVREASPADVDAVQRVARAAWHAAHDHILGEETVTELLTQWYDKEGLKERIAREDAPMLLAVVDTEVVGFIQGVPGESGDDPAEAIVGSIYVHPEHWNEGIGTKLLSRLFDVFRGQGYNTVCLAVLTENEIGRSFYGRHSFEIHEERTVELAGQEVDDVVLVRDL